MEEGWSGLEDTGPSGAGAVLKAYNSLIISLNSHHSPVAAPPHRRTTARLQTNAAATLLYIIAIWTAV